MGPVVGTVYADLNIPAPTNAVVRVTLDPSGLVSVSCNRSDVVLSGVPLRVASVYIVAVSAGKYRVPTSTLIASVPIRVTVNFATAKLLLKGCLALTRSNPG